MFLPIEGGSIVDVQGLPCALPAPGTVWCPKELKYVKTGIHRRHKLDEETFWEADPRWKKYRLWQKEEVRRRELQEKNREEVSFVHADLRRFIKEMWLRRLRGMWFYNNGIPTYITGQNWFYLEAYQADFGTIDRKPRYRDVDRLYFYAWQYCCEDPDCFGLVEVTKRRSGKTYRAGSIAIEFTTRLEMFQSGIQSKNEKDANSVFKKAIIGPYRKLPYFFRPKDNLSKAGRPPAGELRFAAQGSEFEDDELESWIDYRPSTLGAYDGQKVRYYFGDEEGKTIEIDVYERWMTVQPCLVDDDMNIIGKSVHTTTVEEMEKGGEAFLEMWNDSNQRDRGADDKGNKRIRTKSGLYRIFFPADLTGKLDKYGFSDRPAVRKQILDSRIGLSARAKASAMRKFPLDEDEAFQTDAAGCAFNIDLLNERETILKALINTPKYRRGNFHWKGGMRDTTVYWKDDPDGRFLMAWRPRKDLRNRKLFKNGLWYPGDKSGGGGGVDPYDHIVLAERGEYTMSYGSIVFVKRENPMDNSEVEGGPCLVYLSRPDNPHTFYEDAIKAAVYYGWQVLIETNKPGCLQYFQDRGYQKYCYVMPGKPDDKPGIAASARSAGGGTNALVAEITAQFIEEGIDKVFFLELVRQWKRFSPLNTTKYDLAMAFGYAYMLVQRITVKENRKAKQTKQVPVASLLSWSRRNKRRTGRGMLR